MPFAALQRFPLARRLVADDDGTLGSISRLQLWSGAVLGSVDWRQAQSRAGGVRGRAPAGRSQPDICREPEQRLAMTDGGRYPSVVLMCILLTLGVSYAIPAVLYDNVLPQGGSISGWVRDNLPSLADRMRVLEAAQFLQMCDLEQCIASMEYTSADIAWILRETHLAETTLERIVEGTPAYRMLRDADVKQDGIQQKEAIVEEIRTLLITGYGDIDLVNNGCFDRNFNVLHWATFRNRPEVVELLLSIPGVVVTDWPKPNGHGFVSPLQHAELHGFTRLVELLLRFPDIAVDAGAGTPWGTTLHLAAGKFSHEDGSDGTRIVELLIGHGANVSALDARGSTPLHAAAEFGRTDIVEVLLDNGADINHQDSRDGRTPLHEAVAWGQEACVDMLIRNDMVDTSLKDQGVGRHLTLADDQASWTWMRRPPTDHLLAWLDTCPYRMPSTMQPHPLRFISLRKLTLRMDASDFAIGLVASQHRASGLMRPAAFPCSQLSPADIICETHNKELCATIEASVRRRQCQLKGYAPTYRNLAVRFKFESAGSSTSARSSMTLVEYDPRVAAALDAAVKAFDNEVALETPLVWCVYGRSTSV